MKPRGGKRAGSSVMEFTMIGIPLIFVLISTFEIGRGMWIYHTVAYAVKEGTRYAAVHGATCAPPANDCLKTVADVARRIQRGAVGLDAASMDVTLNPGIGGAETRKLSDWLRVNNTWPPVTANAPGRDVEITASYPFQSMICMFWPGTKGFSAVRTYNMPAAARERIQF